MPNFYQAAFDQVCTEAKEPETWYVCLTVDSPYYGGPEEGGWWGTDTTVVAYQEFQTENAAQEARAKVQKLAKQLSEDSKREFGEHCLRQLDYLEERGLDDDYFPEPDGEERYFVTVTEHLPQSHRGERQYS